MHRPLPTLAALAPALALSLTLAFTGCAADGTSPLGKLLPAPSPPATPLPGEPTGTAGARATTPGSPARPGAGNAASSAADSAAQIRIGNQTIDPATVVLDPQCQRLVEPFEIGDNVAELASLGAGMLGDNASSILGSQLARLNPKAAPAAAPPVKLGHNIPAHLRRTAVRMNWLPMPMEVMYGEHLLGDMKAGLVPRDSRIGPALYARADALLAEVLASVTERHAYQFKLFISSQAGDNAMALPGGLIVIDKALVDKPELRDKAYFALSHEIAHVLQRHETRSVQARIVDTVSLKSSLPELIKTMRQVNSEPAAVVSLVLAGKLLFEKHFVNQELQSDACAVRLVDRTLKDPRRVRASIQAFVNALTPSDRPADRPTAPGRALRPGSAGPALVPPGSADSAEVLVELVTRPIDRHPSTGARIQNLNAMLRTLQATPVRPATAAGVAAPAAPAASAAKKR